MKGRSLRLRLVAASAISVMAALALAFFGLTRLFASHVERQAVHELTVQLDQLLAGIERDAEGRLVVRDGPRDARFVRPLGGLYWQVEAEGRQLRSRSLWDFVMPLAAEELSDGTVHVRTLPGPGGTRLLAVQRRVILPARLGRVPLVAAVATDTRRLEKAVEEFREDLLPYTGLLAVFLIVAAGVQVVVGLRPLDAVGRRVARVRSGEISRLGAEFPSEIQPLAQEVDALLAQRERDIEQARRRAGDLAHGLKTPLQALLGEAGRLRTAGQEAAADAIEQITDTMRRHVDRELARVRVAARAASAQCDLAEVAGRVVAVVRRAVGKKGGDELLWQLDIPAGTLVAAEAEDVLEILGALVENAARYARTRVRLSAAGQDGRVVLSVEDDGPGMPDDLIGRLGSRGVRADESGPGTGLGLAIAREISEALGGGLELGRGALGGCRVRVVLPRAAT